MAASTSDEPARDDPAALAEQALDPKKLDDVEKAIANLTPDEAQHFVGLLERAIKRRRIQLIGYAAALVVLLAGQVGALAYYGTTEPGQFVGWIFFIPFLLVGIVFYVFGAWANRVK